MLKRLLDRLFGYDFFISYAHGDGINYPRRLAAQLKEKRFSVFLDEEVYVGGDDLREATARRVRMSKKLVVIARRQALTSEWVEKEVSTCLEAKRTPIIVDINASFAGASESVGIKKLCQDRIYIAEELDQPDGNPSNRVLDGLARSFQSTRQEVIRLWVVGLLAAVFAAVAVVAVWQYRSAKVRRDIAVSRELAAESMSRLAADPELGILLATEAARVKRTVQAEDALRRSLAESHVRVVLRGHTDRVNNASFSPDGSRIVTASDDCTARVWDVKTGKSLVILEGHKKPVRWGAFIRRGNLVVTEGADGTARVWEVDTGKSMAILETVSNVGKAEFNPQETVILTISADGTARIREVATGLHTRLQRQHKNVLIRSVLSPDGRLIVVPVALSVVDHKLQIWDTKIGGKSAETRQASGAVWKVLFSPDGHFLVTATGDLFTAAGYNRADVWDTSTWKRVAQLQGHAEDVREAAFSPNGELIVTASEDGTARVWRVRTWQSLEVLRGHTGAVASAKFSSDSKLIVTASQDGTARIWDVETGRQVALLAGHTREISDATFSSDGASVVTASGDNTARVWAVTEGERLALLPRATGGAFSPDGRWLVTGGRTGAVWEMGAWRRVAALPGSCIGATFSPQADRVITAGKEYNSAQLWEVGTWKRVRALRREGEDVVPWHGSRRMEPLTPATYSPDGTLAVIPAAGRAAQVWETRTGKLVYELHGNPNNVRSAAFSPDGRFVVTVSDEAHVWEVGTWKEVARLRGEGKYWLNGWDNVSFSPDGKWMVTAIQNDRAHVWEVGTWRHQAELRGHTSVVWTAAFSHDSKWVVTGSGDGTARVWVARTGKNVAVLRGHELSVRSVSFSPIGKCIVTSDSSSVRVWEAPAGRTLAFFTNHSAPAFSPDGKVIIASTSKGLGIYALEVCGSIQDLLGLCARRVTRELSQEERASYRQD